MAVRLDVELSGVRVQFSGADLVAACSRGLFLPFTRILGVRVMTRPDAVASSPRFPCPGFWWSRRYRAGCWGIGERRQLWSARQSARVVVIYPSRLTDASTRPCCTARRPALDGRSATTDDPPLIGPSPIPPAPRSARNGSGHRGTTSLRYPRTRRRRGGQTPANSRPPHPRDRHRRDRQQRTWKARAKAGLPPANLSPLWTASQNTGKPGRGQR
jgi:hypothetical protein